MLRKIVYFFITIALFVGAGFLVVIAPYHIYTLTLTEGLNTRFLQMDPTKSVFYDGNVVNMGPPVNMDDEGLYQNFHFYHYELPRISAWLQVVSSRDLTCADLPEEAF